MGAGRRLSSLRPQRNGARTRGGGRGAHPSRRQPQRRRNCPSSCYIWAFWLVPQYASSPLHERRTLDARRLARLPWELPGHGARRGGAASARASVSRGEWVQVQFPDNIFKGMLAGLLLLTRHNPLGFTTS